MGSFSPNQPHPAPSNNNFRIFITSTAIGAIFSGCVATSLKKLSSLDIRIIDAVIPHWKHAAAFGALAVILDKGLTKIANKLTETVIKSNEEEEIDEEEEIETDAHSSQTQSTHQPRQKPHSAHPTVKKVFLVINPILAALSSAYIMKIATNTIIPPSFALLCATHWSMQMLYAIHKNT